MLYFFSKTCEVKNTFSHPPEQFKARYAGRFRFMDSDGIPKLSAFFRVVEHSHSGGADVAAAPAKRAESSPTSAWPPPSASSFSGSMPSASILPTPLLRSSAVCPTPPTPATSDVGSRGFSRRESAISQPFASPAKTEIETDDGDSDGAGLLPAHARRGENRLLGLPQRHPPDPWGSLLGVAEQQAEL